MSRARKKNPSPAKKSREQRSNSTKVTALNMMKRGDTCAKVAWDLKVWERTLWRWKQGSIAAGKWDGPDGDGLARPAERRKDPGTGTKNRKITDEIKKVIKRKLRFNPFLTAYRLQQCIQELANVSQRTIMHCVAKELRIPSRIADKSIKTWLTDSKVPVLDWVGNSPDCNPIENLWRGLKKEVNKFGATSNLDELADKIRKAWKNLAKDKRLLSNLTNSMPARIEAVIAAKGDVTKY